MCGRAVLLVPSSLLADLEKARRSKTQAHGIHGTPCIDEPSVQKKRQKRARARNNYIDVVVEVPKETELPCDEAMADWALSKECRRVVQDKYYGNPKRFGEWVSCAL